MPFNICSVRAGETDAEGTEEGQAEGKAAEGEPKEKHAEEKHEERASLQAVRMLYACTKCWLSTSACPTSGAQRLLSPEVIPHRP